MRQRCTDSGVPSYKDYGGRGIKICERWESFENFFADIGSAPSSKHSLDRFPDVNGNYEPGNTRWATQKEQQRNRRNNIRVTYNGETRCISEWAEIYGMERGLLWRRIVRFHWPVELALVTPALPRIHRHKTVDELKAIYLPGS